MNFDKNILMIRDVQINRDREKTKINSSFFSSTRAKYFHFIVNKID